MSADLDASEAEVLAGDTVPLDEMLTRLQRELDEWMPTHAPEPQRRFGM
ncbi:MAG TPA: hypothetical protein VIR38_02520 [Thalassobaculum sp.]